MSGARRADQADPSDSNPWKLKPQQRVRIRGVRRIIRLTWELVMTHQRGPSLTPLRGRAT
jgi:hypothetical protein